LQENLSFQVIPSSLAEIYDKVMAIGPDCDVVLIDMPGFLHTPDGSRQQITDFLFYVDVMLLPLKVHDFDALNLLEFNKVVEEVIAKRKADYNLPPSAAYFLNDLHLKREAREFERLLEQQNLPLLGRNLSRSVSYERGVRSGDSLLTYSGTPAKISNEFRLFMNAITKLL
jgi:cellulose biosynthesis protein BcsQ